MNPFQGTFSLYATPELSGERQAQVEVGSVGLVLAVTGSFMYVLVGDRLGWAAFGLFDRVL